jgi:hypothetical protein
METVLAPKVPVSRNAPCPCGSGKRYKHCHGAIKPFSFTPHRLAEYEAQVIANVEAEADPTRRLNSRINLLIMEGKSFEAATLLVQEFPHFLPTNTSQVLGTRTETPIERLVIGNGPHLMWNADADDLEEACGLPVVLADLNAGQGREALAPKTLVISTGTSHPTLSWPDLLRAVRAHTPGCMVVVWLFDNHHSYLINAQVACSADRCFPSHPIPMDYLSQVALGRIGPRIPLATVQWSRPQLSRLWKLYERERRSDALSGHYALYPQGHRRNVLLAQAIEDWPQTDLSLRRDMSYHRQSPENRFLQWRRYKASVCLPLVNDLSNRFFDALAAGQVPIAAPDILDLDRVIPPDLQTSLPIIRLQDYTVAALRDAHERAIAAYDSEGNEGAERRHRFVLGNHMLANRIRLLVEETAHLSRSHWRQSDGFQT